MKTNKINRKETFREFVRAIAYASIVFFVVVTGTTLLPEIARISGEWSYVSFFYAISILIIEICIMYKIFSPAFEWEKEEVKLK